MGKKNGPPILKSIKSMSKIGKLERLEYSLKYLFEGKFPNPLGEESKTLNNFFVINSVFAFRRFPEKKIPGSLPELVEGKFLQLPSTSSGNGIIFSGNHLISKIIGKISIFQCCLIILVFNHGNFYIMANLKYIRILLKVRCSCPKSSWTRVRDSS